MSFKLKYAPHLAQFFTVRQAKSLSDELKLRARRGFPPPGKGQSLSPADSRGAEGDRRNDGGNSTWSMGVFVVKPESAGRHLSQLSLVQNDDRPWISFSKDIKKGIEGANAATRHWMTGRSSAPDDFEEATGTTEPPRNCIELLKRCFRSARTPDLVMVLEPLTARWKSPTCFFFREIPAAYQICKAVEQPRLVKIFVSTSTHQQDSRKGIDPEYRSDWSRNRLTSMGGG